MNRSITFLTLAAIATGFTAAASRSALSGSGQTGALVRLQSSTPGVAQAGNLNVGGTGLFTRVGVGTSASLPLDVSGNVRFGGAAPHSLSFTNGNTSTLEIGIAGSTGQYSTSAVLNDVVIRNNAPGRSILFQNGPGEAALAVTAFGRRVGIGTNNPDGHLHVVASDTLVGQFTSSNSFGTYLDLQNTTGRFWHLVSTGSSTPEGNGKLLVGYGSASAVNDGVPLALTPSGIGMFTANPSTALQVVGTITGSFKFFTIDNPRDPANSYLRHACIESDQAMNLYRGVVKTDERGLATVKVPGWFEALNEDIQYQVTVVDEESDGFVQVKIQRKLRNGQFVIRTSAPGAEVNWQLTGERKDAYAKAHPLVVEEPKPKEEQGYYLHPEEHGVPKELGMNYVKRGGDPR